MGHGKQASEEPQEEKQQEHGGRAHLKKNGCEWSHVRERMHGKPLQIYHLLWSFMVKAWRLSLVFAIDKLNNSKGFFPHLMILARES